MKLYANVTSERATKGQGGNDFIDIVVKGEDQKNILELKITPHDNHYKITGYAINGGNLRSESYISYEVRKEKNVCTFPSLSLQCTWCGWVGKCGMCKHDGDGPLCPTCSRGGKLKVIEETKGEKQKGEKCYCSDDDMSLPHIH